MIPGGDWAGLTGPAVAGSVTQCLGVCGWLWVSQGRDGMIGSSEPAVWGGALTSVLGVAQPHLGDLPTPGLQLRVSPHGGVARVEEMDHSLHVPARRRSGAEPEQRAASPPRLPSAAPSALTAPGQSRPDLRPEVLLFV